MRCLLAILILVAGCTTAHMVVDHSRPEYMTPLYKRFADEAKVEVAAIEPAGIGATITDAVVSAGIPQAIAGVVAVALLKWRVNLTSELV